MAIRTASDITEGKPQVQGWPAGIGASPLDSGLSPEYRTGNGNGVRR